MLTITQSAVKVLTAERASRGAPDSYGVRIFAALPPGAEAPQVALAFVPEPAAGDEVTEHEGLTAYLAPEVTDTLSGATLDAAPIDGSTELVLRR